MPPETTVVYDFVHFALAAAGLVVAALYFTVPKIRLWRRAAGGAAEWVTPFPDSLLLAASALLALLFGGMLGAGIASFLPNAGAADSPARTVCAMAGGFIAVPLALAATCWYLRSNKTPVASVIAPGAPRFLEAVGLGVATFLLAHPLMVGTALASAKLLNLLHIDPVAQPGLKLLTADAPPLVRASMVLTAVVLAPIAEELIFRAGLFRFLRVRMPRWAALLLSAAVFGAAHTNLASALPLFALGFIWAYAYEKTGNIVVTIVAHGLFNLTTIALAIGGYAPLQ